MAKRKAFPLRLPPKLYDELQRWAAMELRSLNAQIEYLLRQAVARRNKTNPDPDDETGETKEEDREGP